MAHREKRLTSKGTLRYGVRWLLPGGTSREKRSLRWGDASAYKRKLEHDQLDRVVVDPR